MAIKSKENMANEKESSSFQCRSSMVRSELSNQTQQWLLHLQPEAASPHYKNILQMITGVFMDTFL